MVIWKKALVPVAAALAICCDAQAADDAGTAAEDATDADGGVFTVQWENDILAGTDRHYTNGIRLSWVSPELREQLPWVADALHWLYPFDPGADARVGVAVGQSMFTPGDITTSELILDDRPYAGWLYVGFSLHVAARQGMFGHDVDFLDTLQLNAGVVGPASLAEESQKFVHDVIGAQRPNGWDNQLQNEPGFALILERKWRTPPLDLGWIQADAIPSVAVSLGNVETSGGVAAMVRVGHALEVDYGPPNISSNLTGREFFDRIEGDLAWYLFAGAGGRLVARNIFLDGNTFRDSHSVEKNNFVGDLQAGAAVVYKGWRLAFTAVLRSQEFDKQGDPDKFGAISLSVRF